MELGYNPKEFLASSAEYQAITIVNRTHEFQQLSTRLKAEINAAIPKDSNFIADFVPNKPTAPQLIGLMWADFDVDNNGTTFVPGRDLCYGQQLTEQLLQKQSNDTVKIVAIFRAHQHHGTMLEQLKRNKGIVSLYDGLVYTFLSVPVFRTDFSIDSIGILHINDTYKLCSLEHHVIPTARNT